MSALFVVLQTDLSDGDVPGQHEFMHVVILYLYMFGV